MRKTLKTQDHHMMILVAKKLNEASTIASTVHWVCQDSFQTSEQKKRKAYFVEISEEKSSSNPNKQFCVTVSLPIMGILYCQLINRFGGTRSMVASYQVLEPGFRLNASHLDFEVEARIFFNKFSDNVFPLFPSQMLSIKTSFGENIAYSISSKKNGFFFDC